MRAFRIDPVTGRLVILATDRQLRPRDFVVERASAIGRETCPFCPGHEAMTPPEVLADRPGAGAHDTPGWDVRVVPNKFPALSMDGTNGVGVHEVIIETPDHDRPLATRQQFFLGGGQIDEHAGGGQVGGHQNLEQPRGRFFGPARPRLVAGLQLEAQTNRRAVDVDARDQGLLEEQPLGAGHCGLEPESDAEPERPCRGVES